jgi:hypothetical protein
MIERPLQAWFCGDTSSHLDAGGIAAPRVDRGMALA